MSISSFSEILKVMRSFVARVFTLQPDLEDIRNDPNTLAVSYAPAMMQTLHRVLKSTVSDDSNFVPHEICSFRKLVLYDLNLCGEPIVATDIYYTSFT
jgi:hypothetical protein